MKVTAAMIFATRMLMAKLNINSFELMTVLAALDKENKNV